MLFKAFGPGPCSEELGRSREKLLVLARPLGDYGRVRGVRDGAGSSVLDGSVRGSCRPGASRDAAQGETLLSGRDRDPHPNGTHAGAARPSWCCRRGSPPGSGAGAGDAEQSGRVAPRGSGGDDTGWGGRQGTWGPFEGAMSQIFHTRSTRRSFPGPVSLSEGRLLILQNLPCMAGTRVKPTLRRQARSPVASRGRACPPAPLGKALGGPQSDGTDVPVRLCPRPV